MISRKYKIFLRYLWLTKRQARQADPAQSDGATDQCPPHNDHVHLRLWRQLQQWTKDLFWGPRCKISIRTGLASIVIQDSPTEPLATTQGPNYFHRQGGPDDQQPCSTSTSSTTSSPPNHRTSSKSITTAEMAAAEGKGRVDRLDPFSDEAVIMPAPRQSSSVNNEGTFGREEQQIVESRTRRHTVNSAAIYKKMAAKSASRRQRIIRS